MRLRNIPGARDVIAESPHVVQEPEACCGRWREVFGNDHPIRIEVGMGKGKFLLEMAALHPEINWIGIEMYSSVLLRAIQRAETLRVEGDIPEQTKERGGACQAGNANVPSDESGMTEDFDVGICANFRFLRMDARDLEIVFAPGEVDRIYLHFSDPWPKARHADRRLTSLPFLRRYEKILAEDGVVIFKTDNTDLFAFSLEEIAAAGWTLYEETWDLYGALASGSAASGSDDCINGIAASGSYDGSAAGENSDSADARAAGNDRDCTDGQQEPGDRVVMTEYEARFAAEGKPICRLVTSPRKRT